MKLILNRCVMMCLLAMIALAGAKAQSVLAFQGGENGTDDNWNYTDTGANSEAINQSLLPPNYRSGAQSMAVGGTDPAGGSCFAGGAGNGAVINNVFTFGSIDLQAYPGEDKTLEFWFGSRQPYCNGSGWDNGEDLIFTPVIDGLSLAPIVIVNGGGDISLSIGATSYSYAIPPCAESFGFTLSIALNRRDELLFLDDVSLILESDALPESIDAGAGGSLCLGASFELFGSATAGLNNIEWSGGEGTFAGSTSPSTIYTAGPDEEGIVVLSLSGTTICGSILNSTVELLIEGQAPIASIVSSEGNAICDGQVTVLTAFGGIDYVWSTGAIGEDIIIDMPGSYSVTVSNECGDDTAQIVLAPGDLIGIDETRYLCIGAALVLPDGVEVDSPGVYNSLIEVAGACDSLFTIEVLEAPGLSVSPPEANCNYTDSTYTLTFNVQGGLEGSYQVTGLAGAFTGGVFISSAIDAGEEYSYGVTDANGCENFDFSGMEACICPASATLTGNDTICAGQSSNIQIALSGEAPWQITFQDGLVSNTIVSSDSLVQLEVSPTGSTTYGLVGVTDMLCTGSVSGTAVVTVLPLPDAGTGSSISLCDNDSPIQLLELLEGNPEQGGTWTYAGTPAEGTFIPALDSPGPYVYTVDGGICGSATSMLLVLVREAPFATLSGSYLLCPGQNVLLPLDLQGQGALVVNLALDGSPLPPYHPANPPFQYPATETGAYTVISIADAYCSAPGTGVAIVEAADSPVARFDFKELGVANGITRLAFKAESVVEGSAYTWRFFAINSAGSLSARGSGSGPSVVFAPRSPSTGTFRACLSVVNTAGCITELCKIFEIISDRHFYMPNAFSPNGDGKNDLFHPVMQGYEDYDFEMKVYDRNGALLYQSGNPQGHWNGSNMGGSYYVPAGIYQWQVVLRASDGSEDAIFRGHVSMIR